MLPVLKLKTLYFLLIILFTIGTFSPFVFSIDKGIGLQISQNNFILGTNAPLKLATAGALNRFEDNVVKYEFRLTIPRAEVNKAVQENVDPAREEIYGPVITEKIAHGKFTRLPEEAVLDGNVYLFAHREGTLNGRDIGYFKHLDRIVDGDKAFIRYGNKLYVYTFVQKFIIEPNDTWVYTERSPYPALTLQTCEDGEKLRLIVKFRLIEVR